MPTMRAVFNHEHDTEGNESHSSSPSSESQVAATAIHHNLPQHSSSPLQPQLNHIHITLSTTTNEQSLLNSPTTHYNQPEQFSSIPPPNHASRNRSLSPIRQTRPGLPLLAIPGPQPEAAPRTFNASIPIIPPGSASQADQDANGSNNHTRSGSLSDATTPETPASLSSPIVGVVDLTKHVRTTSNSPVSHGGFSDIYCGEWEKEWKESENGDTKKKCINGYSDDPRQRLETIKVAIKLLRVMSSSGYDEARARKRLNREVYVWHRLEHPNIVNFFGTSYHMGGRPSLVLPWFSNGCAPDYLRRNPQTDRLQLILDIARGLQYLHTSNPPIVHGDLKGNNILIADDGRGTLSDFGLAQVIGSLYGPNGYTPSADTPDLAWGPVRWLAPELLMDDDAGRPQMPGDIWSFGCTAYELLTGNIPYHFRKRDPPVIQDIQSGIPPPGTEENAKRQGDGGIWDLLNECWIISPTERIKINDVVSRLEDICARQLANN